MCQSFFCQRLVDKSYSLHELSDPAQAITSYKERSTCSRNWLDKVAELEKSFGNRVSQLDDLSKSVSNKVYGSMNRVPVLVS